MPGARVKLLGGESYGYPMIQMPGMEHWSYAKYFGRLDNQKFICRTLGFSALEVSLDEFLSVSPFSISYIFIY